MKGRNPESVSTTTNSGADALEALANDQPTNFKVEAGNALIKVTWDPPLEPGINADGTVPTRINYTIAYKKSSADDSTSVALTPITGTELTIGPQNNITLDNEVEYTVYLVALNTSGKVDASSARQMLTATPSAVAPEAAPEGGYCNPYGNFR